MGEKTAFERTDHAFNPPMGCARARRACDNRGTMAMSQYPSP
jgi:protein gp37